MIEQVLGGCDKNGCGQSGHGTLKLTLSQEWIDYFHEFWVDVVTGGHGYLVY